MPEQQRYQLIQESDLKEQPQKILTLLISPLILPLYVYAVNIYGMITL